MPSPRASNRPYPPEGIAETESVYETEGMAPRSASGPWIPGRPRHPIRLPGPPRAVLLWLLAFFVLLSPSPAGAHPHIFFDIELDVHFGRNAECRVEIRLHPDEMTGRGIACMGDENDDW